MSEPFEAQDKLELSPQELSTLPAQRRQTEGGRYIGGRTGCEDELAGGRFIVPLHEVKDAALEVRRYKGASLFFFRPGTCLRYEVQTNRKSAAGERPPVNNTRPSPEVASARLEEQTASRFPNSLRHHAGAMGTNVLRARRFRN
jgi:hypothetical protein